MKLLIALLASVIFVAAFRKPLAKWPVVFYVIAIVIDIIFVGQMFFNTMPVATHTLFPYIYRCLFAFWLLAIVMFTGAFASNSKLRRLLAPIRGELSIFASILVAGHVVNYLRNYLMQIFGGFGAMSGNMIAGFIVSAVLVVLLAILTVTSFTFVRKRMTPASWKKLQKWSYVFFGLVYAHIMLLLLPSALGRGSTSLLSATIYTIVFVIYIILRIRRTVTDRRIADALVENPASQ